MGLATFVLTAVAARFVYPAVSMEGEAFWIVRSSPVKIRTLLWIKFCLYYVPLLILTEILIVVSNILLHVTPFMMVPVGHDGLLNGSGDRIHGGWFWRGLS